MQTGRSFAAHFEDDASREAYLAWSAAQMIVYNAKVDESNYFWKFHCKFWSPEPLPKPDQKYAHLVNPDTVPWVKEVPSAVRGIGAYRFYQAMTRFMRGLSKRPHRKPIRNADRQLTLTRDCFAVKQVSQKWWELTFGPKKKTAGRIRFRAHRRFEMPAMVMITCTNQCLQLGFSYEDELTEFPETEEEILARLRKLTPEELTERTIGGDVGVKIRLQLSQLESLAALYIARLLQGFASGLTASAVIAWIVESIPAVYAKSSAVSAAIVGGGPSIGFAVGALLTGIWVESLKMPLQWLILSLGTAAVLTLPAIFLSAETAHCRPIPLKDLLICAGRHRSAGDRSYGKNGSAHLGTDGGDLYEIQTEKTIRPIIEKRRV